MSDLIRDSTLGQIIRLVTGNKVLLYPEERPDFKLPESYLRPGEGKIDSESSTPAAERTEPALPNVESVIEAAETPEEVEKQETTEVAVEPAETENELAKAATAYSTRSTLRRSGTSATQRTGMERVASRTALSNAVTQADLEREFTVATVAKGPTEPIHPVTLDDGTILVDFYDTDDPANPQNWSQGKKAFTAFQICFYTFAVYMGSAIYSPSVEGVMHDFGVSLQEALLGLSMYVVAYGLGPMLFAPMSEIPAIGRNPPYMLTFAIFVILCVPTSLVGNFPGLIILRFLQGFFGSPCLATGGASMSDLYSLIKLPYILSIWALAATCGPALGPIISGFSVTAMGWRWSLWEILWLAGPTWILLFICLPETHTPNILLNRARRLRKLTGDNRYKSQSEIDQKNLNPRDIAIESLWRPIQLIVLDPSIAFTAVYIAIAYGIFYSFFEVFPLVYIGMYGFNLGEMGLTFLSITVAVILAIASYWAYNYWVAEPWILANGMGAPERRLIPALVASVMTPVGLFIFGWTARDDVHWIVSLIGVMIFTFGVFLIFQCVFLYLPLSYPQYAASLFAGNDFSRSFLAAGAIHFSSPLFVNLGIGPGVSLLAGLTCGCVVGLYILYIYGAQLRAKSRFAAK